MNKISKKLFTEFQTSRKLLFLVFTFCMVATLSFFVSGNAHRSSAANPNNFNAGNIISDAVMANYTSMTEQDIQNFLNSKNTCDNRNYDLYLQYTKAHPTISWHWEGEPYNGHFVCLAEEKFGDTASEIGTGKTAAQIIYEAAQEYRINPQVLLVLLQKESSLITDKVPNSFDYGQATGYGCPDTAACDKKYSGFKNQVSRAAELFRYVLDHNSVYYPAGRTVYVGYHPSSSCGGTQVRIENRATAALYQYTPYQPNAASLNAGYGQGDSCSAYGNRNFYLYFSDWFGSTQLAVEGTVVNIPDGIYGLTTKLNPDNVMEVIASRTTNGANVQIWDQLTSASQKWIFRQVGGGYYTITDAYSGKNLDVANAEMSNGANAQIYSANNTCAQQWKIYRTDDEYYMLESACQTGIMLDVEGDDGDDGANVQVWTVNGSDSQKWQLYSGEVIADGDYLIRSGLAYSRVLEAAGGGITDGTNVHLWVDNSTIAQKWSIIYDKTQDAYTVTNQKSSKKLSLEDVAAANGKNIQIEKNKEGCSQYWKIIKTPDNYYTFMSVCDSQYTLDLNEGKSDNGTNLQLYASNNTLAQKWSLTKLPDESRIIADGTYVLHSNLSYARVIEVAGGAQTANTNIQLWVDNTTNAQKWSIKYDLTEHAYSIASNNTTTVMYLSEDGTDTNVILSEPDGTCNQYWYIEKNSDGTYSFTSKCNRSVAIDVYNGDTEYGTNIWVWPKNSTNAQKWILVEQ